MPSIRDLWPDKWLKAEHLLGRTVLVAIEQARVERLFNPQTKREEPKLILSFRKKALRMILNKTQAFALAQATGTDDYNQWPGHQIVVSPGIAPNQRPTIVISRPPEEAKDKNEAVPENHRDAERN